jgi:AmmeMemoRadiSam system protein A
MVELLTKKEQKELLKIARETIVDYIANGQIPLIETTSKGLACEHGCFVTIKQQQQLRGCIGNFVSDKPLFKLVQEMAVSAATRDPRFYPMKSTDMEDFSLEISVLSPLEKITSVDQIQVGKHGLYIIKNSYRGVLLPQVASEYNWDRETFLKNTCTKAGLPENAWQKECDIYIFSAMVFGEHVIETRERISMPNEG